MFTRLQFLWKYLFKEKDTILLGRWKIGIDHMKYYEHKEYPH